MGLYTVLRPYLKGENTNITKNNLKLKDFIFFIFFFFFKKLIFSGEISLNNMRSDLAVKCLSLISIKSEQVSKICSMVKCLSHLMHIGSSSPLNKKELEKMADVQSGHHSFFFSVFLRTRYTFF